MLATADLRHQGAGEILTEQLSQMTAADTARVHLDQRGRFILGVEHEIEADEAGAAERLGQRSRGLGHFLVLDMTNDGAGAGRLRMDLLGDEADASQHAPLPGADGAKGRPSHRMGLGDHVRRGPQIESGCAL